MSDLTRDEAEAVAALAMVANSGPGWSPWDPDYGACICGARRGQPCITDHSEIMCATFVGGQLQSIQTGGPNGKTMWSAEADGP